MTKQGNVWSIVLAGGDGSRLSQIAVGPEGLSVPKQYCSVNGGPSLIRRALRRARRIAGPDRTMAVVAAEHRCWWSLELADLPSVRVVVQPCNRGTACGVLLPLMQVIARDPDATVVVLPSDHVVADESTLLASINAAVEHIDREQDRLVLLGVEPEGADTGFGWIAPRFRSGDQVSPVARFVEKPDRERAEELVREGALWNSFIFAMRAEELFALFEWALPWLTKMFDYALVESGAGPQAARVAQLYERLPAVDFSRAVLQEAGADMRVVAVPPCGWTDVGTPEGIARCQKGCGRHTVSGAEQSSAATPPVDLAEALGTFRDGPEPGGGESPISAGAD